MLMWWAFGHSFGPMAVMSSFPNEDSILRLIGAILFEQNADRQSQHRYMPVEAFSQIDTAQIDPLLSITTQAA